MQSNTVGQPERATQNRAVSLFMDELDCRYLGDWTDRLNNSNIEEGLLTAYLTKSGYSPVQISRALDRLRTEAGNPNRSLYDNNKAVYSLLRYGVQVAGGSGQKHRDSLADKTLWGQVLKHKKLTFQDLTSANSITYEYVVAVTG